MAAPVFFRSTDAGAPALNGNAGSLVNVLDWCLDTGTNAGALGWGIAFTAASKRVYRAASGVRHYIDINDNSPDGTALGRNAQVRGYEVMTAIATGTGPFPTVAQVATPVGIVKSTATGTTARPWIAFGDALTFYILCNPALTDPPTLSTVVWNSGFYFGEILSQLTGDLYRSIISYDSVTATAVAAAPLGGFNMLLASNSTAVINENMPRSYTGAGGGIWAGLLGNNAVTTAATGRIDVGQFTFPNPVDGGLPLNAMDIYERGSGATAAGISSSGGLRGKARGIYQTPFTNTGVDDQTTFTAIGTWAGRTFILLRMSAGLMAVETTAWASSS